MPRAPVKLDLQLAEEIANYYADPLGFVLFAYPWGEPGVLRDATGPAASGRVIQPGTANGLPSARRTT